MTIARLIKTHKHFTIQYRNRYLHSARNPIIEAQRLIKQQIRIRNPLAIIILEPGIGYLIDQVRSIFKNSIVFAVHIDSELCSLTTWRADYTWHPHSAISLNIFLENIFRLVPSPRIATIIPPFIPSIAADFLKKFNTMLRALILINRTELATVGVFGSKWMRNCIVNFLHIQRSVTFTPQHTRIVCIVGSGASLNAQIALIKKFQKQWYIWALPSAIDALLWNNIIPDLIINTDGGYWAKAHFMHIPHNLHIPIAMPLTAIRGMYTRDAPIVLLNQNFAIENSITTKIAPSMYQMETHGTVAASAIRLAHLAQMEHVLLAGIDCAFVNNNIHCKPHSFEEIYNKNSTVFNPMGLAQYQRLIEAPKNSRYTLRIHNRHAIYQEDIRALIQHIRHMAVYQLPSDNPVTVAAPIDEQRLRLLVGRDETDKKNMFHTHAIHLSSAERTLHIRTLLQSAIATISRASAHGTLDRLQKELFLSLTPQAYNAYWSLHGTRGAWSALKQQAIDTLTTWRERYCG